ncbi:MAG: hypothetical protein ACI9MC_003162, partial [Kiritimatiellia bacterium]
SRYNRLMAGVDLRYTPLRGEISIADEAILPVQVSAIFGLRLAQQRLLWVPQASSATSWNGRSLDPELVGADLHPGPNIGVVFSMDLNNRVTLRTDVQAVLFVLPAPIYDLDEGPGAPLATLWPNASVSLAYRI